MAWITLSLTSLRRSRLGRLCADRAGVTALEYGIIASILGLVLVSIFGRFGNTMSTLFSSVGTKI
jgi:pilus assembly protein Flp/PilA